jgi:hypothetical protein
MPRIGEGEPPIKRCREAANGRKLPGIERGRVWSERASTARRKNNSQDFIGRLERLLRSGFPEHTVGNFVHRARDGVEDVE